MNERIIVFSPHPDDETLSCGGTIAINVCLENQVYIVYMTDGRYSHLHTLSISKCPTPKELKIIRASEARQAARALGVKESNLFFLDYEDSKLETKIPYATKTVTKIIEMIKPTEVFYPCPQDMHNDHTATNIIVENALNNYLGQLKCYLYIIWYSENNDKECEQDIVIDISETIKIKKRALSKYRSQITLFSPQQNTPILSQDFLKRFYRNYELFIKRCKSI